MRSNSDKILTALSTAKSLIENQEKVLVGAEYTLFLNADEVMVRANNLAIESDEILEQDFHYYDEESLAFCGTQDFIHFLQSYVDFIA
ncbi:TPA: YacL family protein [Haemophilus influenzae]